MQDREQAAEPAEQPGGAADDAAALEALAAGDLAHFDALVGRHRGRLFGFLWNQTGDAQRAEDLLQETFLRAVNAARSGLGPRNPDATAWLFTIARRLAIDERRRRSARPLRIVDDSRTLDPRRQRAADDALVAAEEHERAAAAPAALPGGAARGGVAAGAWGLELPADRRGGGGAGGDGEEPRVRGAGGAAGRAGRRRPKRGDAMSETTFTDEQARADAGITQAEEARLVALLTPPAPAVSPGFDARLRAALQHTAEPPRRLHVGRWLGSAAGAAAGLAAAVALWLAVAGGVATPTLAWADVTEAVQELQAFHMTVFADKPRNADAEGRMFRIDNFYGGLGRWRAHGLGRVQFGIGDGLQLYEAETGKRVENDRRCPLPDRFARDLERMKLLDALLAWMFRGNPPAGQPVTSDASVAGSDVAVFDYANDATELWARIWVLRESKLPIRMHLYEPGSDAFYLVSFDYSDPQPAAFFDPAAFEAAVKEERPDAAHESFGLLAEPVEGTRPRGSSQLHAVLGGYAAPTVLRVEADPEHPERVLVVTDVLKHRTPRGSTPEQRFIRVRDDLGNLYEPVDRDVTPLGDSEGKLEHPWFFEAIPPVKTGEGTRRLSGTFEVFPHGSEQGNLELMSFDWLAPPAAAGFAEASFEEPEFRRRLIGFLPVVERVAALKQRAAADPMELEADADLVQLLLDLGREEDAWNRFERRLWPARMDDPVQVLVWNGQLVARWLVHLKLYGEPGTFEQARLEAEAALAAYVAEASKQQHWDVERGLGTRAIGRLVSLPETIRYTRENPPKIEQVVRGRDGWVAVRLAIPAYPEAWDENAHGWNGDAPHDWHWQANVDWRPFAGDGVSFLAPGSGAVDLEQRKRWLLFKPKRGVQVTLKSRALLERDWSVEQASLEPKGVAVTWSEPLPADVREVKSAWDWFEKETRGLDVRMPERDSPAWKPRAKSAGDRSADAVREARSAGDPAARLEAIDALLAAPPEAWAENAHERTPSGRAWMQRFYGLAAAEALAELGRFDEAAARLLPIWEDLGPIPAVDDLRREDLRQREQLLDAWASLLRQRLAAGQPDQVRDRIAFLERGRYSAAEVPPSLRFFDKEDGSGIDRMSGWWARLYYQQLWLPLDAVKLELSEAVSE